MNEAQRIGALEAMLFAHAEAVETERLADALRLQTEETRELLLRLRTAYPFSSVPGVVLVAPAPLRCGPGPELSAASVEKSRQLAAIFRDVADRFGCAFLDAGEFAALGADGIHFTPEDHAEMARRAAAAVRALFE